MFSSTEATIGSRSVAGKLSERALPAPSGRVRLLYIDNLRWTMILLVISMHAVDTYSPLGSWYFVNRASLTSLELGLFATWQVYLQAFFMGLLFFLAGVFVPGSLARKGTRVFLRERAFRLGLPVLFYMFVLGPITEYFVAGSWRSTGPTSFAKEWLKHIRNRQILQENGPLWFCLALLIFSVAYALSGLAPARRERIRRLAIPRIRVPNLSRFAVDFSRHLGWGEVGNESGLEPSVLNRDPAFQAKTYQLSSPIRQLVVFALTMTAARFLIRLLLSPEASLLNMHLGDFAQYILMFAAGVSAARGGWLQGVQLELGLQRLRVVLPIGFVVWLIILREGMSQGNWAAFSGGWRWQSLVFSAWESFTCVALCVSLLVIFRQRWNAQGRMAKFLSDNAFAVYVFHPPILILIARIMVRLQWPPLVKAVMLSFLAAGGSFALSSLLFRRIPGLRSIL